MNIVIKCKKGNPVFGLMFSKQKRIYFNLLKMQRVSLHTFFVFYPIDVLFLDIQGQIVEIKRNFRPFCLYTSKKKASCIVEVPAKERIQAYVGNNVILKPC